ncbi:MAG: LysM peptidoglycan-binding domain-containing protein [ANME-2 cluster archaeon]|nr:LysM peptidoglycan-binding domain-containing protein [ANME-2 cluster archaeon]
MLFSTFNATAVIEDHITRTESGFYYTIQKGDTLWDLSEEFSNSPWVWPEMWHYNPHIKNPHLIYPGQKILIYKKEWEGEEKQPEPVADEPVKKIQTYHTFTDIEQVGFIREKAVAHHGTIFKAQDNIQLIDTGKLVYIYPEPGSPRLSVGSRYTTFRTFDPVRDKETDKNYGVQHLLTGVIEITAVESEFALGKVISSYKAILINDHLMPYEKRSVNIPIKESISGLSGKVIKQEAPNNLIGQYSVIFIDKGKTDGIEPGQFYSIYLQQTARPNPKKIRQVELTPYHIGELIVLHTEKTTSTALITKSIQQITSGNLVSTLEVARP